MNQITRIFQEKFTQVKDNSDSEHCSGVFCNKSVRRSRSIGGGGAPTECTR